ncbi:26S proteasome regulatory subunit [Dictyocoela muelleri]|nr:26S proteasome regulatory subunit [Dictyocoela muelleri]
MDLNELLERERKTRLAIDIENHYQVLHLIFSNAPKDQLIPLLKLLINRKSQITSNIKKIMKEIVDENNIYSILNLLDGKILYEEERLIFSDKLREIYEERGSKTKALETINIPIETFCSVSKEAIYDYQLSQLRLAIETKNYDLGLVLSRRFQIQEIEYQIYMIELNKKLKKFYECSKYCEGVINFYKNVLETKGYLTERQEALFDNLTHTFKDKNFELIQKLTLLGSLYAILGEYPEDFASSKHNINDIRKLVAQFKTPKLIKEFPEFISKCELRSVFIEHIKKHNVNVIKRFYKTIKFEDFEMHVGIPIEEIFEIVDGCRIDMENRVCIFEQKNLPLQEVVGRITKALTVNEV